MSTSPFLGRLRQWYAKEETTYGAVMTLAATDALRVLEGELAWNPLDRKAALDKLLTPDLQRRYSNRAVASFDLKKIQLWPSGTIGTPPEGGLDVLLKNGMGTKVTGTLTTTVASAPTTTGAVLTSVTGLAVGEVVGINVAGDQYRGVKITSIVSSTVTWAPALPTAPTAGDTVKAGVTYTLATNPAKSLVIVDYLQTAVHGSQTFIREQRGCVVDKLVFSFDANGETSVEISGPAQQQIAPGQSQPGGFTTVGTALPTGLTGGLRIGAAAYLFQKATITITNGMVVRNVDFGTAIANDFYRKGQRSVDLQIDTYVEDQTVIWTPSLTATQQTVLLQNGIAEGKTWLFYAPICEFDVPSTPDGANELMWSFKGTALGASVGNNEITLAQI